MSNELVIAHPAVKKAKYHVRVQLKSGEPNLFNLPDPRAFGQEALVLLQQLARAHAPEGFRIVMLAGQYGCQPADQPVGFDLLGQEVLRPAIKEKVDLSVPPKPTEVDQKPDGECVFDKFISGKIDVEPELNQDGVFVFWPANEQAEMHYLLAPTTHWRDLTRVTDPRFFGALFAQVVEYARGEDFEGGFQLISNNGPWGGQEMPHFHFHMLGGQQLTSPFWQDWQG